MTRMKAMASPAATVIGDVVSSRGARDRRALHDALRRALTAYARPGPDVVEPLRITVGDEFQGAFVSVGAAVAATLRIRLALLPAYDVRHGVGWGGFTVLEEDPRVEDGPGWWAAREAIEAVAALASRPALRSLRTCYRAAPGAAGAADEGTVNAALMCRDHLVGSLPDAAVGTLRGMLAGRSQADLAADEGISPSAVSQRVRRDGLAVLVAADETWGGAS